MTSPTTIQRLMRPPKPDWFNTSWRELLAARAQLVLARGRVEELRHWLQAAAALADHDLDLALRDIDDGYLDNAVSDLGWYIGQIDAEISTRPEAE